MYIKSYNFPAIFKYIRLDGLVETKNLAKLLKIIRNLLCHHFVIPPNNYK